MTALIIFPESLMRPVYAAVVLMLVMVVVLAAGCISEGKLVQEQDIEIVKINADGSLGWTKTIDYGNDEEMRDIIEMDDGSFIIAGGSSPKRGCNSYATPDPPSYVPTPSEPQLIGFSSTGDILWLQNYSSIGHEGMISVFKNSDGTLNAVTKMGELWHLNTDGSVISNRSINSISWIRSAIKTHDGGYILVSDRDIDYSTGTHITRIDPERTIVWDVRFNKSRFSHIPSVVELPNQQGYLFSANSLHADGSQMVIVRLSPDGTVTNETPKGWMESTDADYLIQPAKDGYVVGFKEVPLSLTTILVRLNADGDIISSGSTDNLGNIFIPTKDGGFFSLYYPASGTIEMKKVDINNTLQWKNDEIKKTPGRIKKIMQTSDDGFVIMGATKKMSRC